MCSPRAAANKIIKLKEGERVEITLNLKNFRDRRTLAYLRVLEIGNLVHLRHGRKGKIFITRVHRRQL